MEHREAVEIQAAERYVLGELPAEQREAFEEHFFDCPECSREVRSCALLLANLRAAVAEQVERESWSPVQRLLAWRPLLPAALAACLLLALAAGYLGIVALPSLKRQIALRTAPQAYPAVFLRPLVRGEEQAIRIPRGAAFLGLWLDVPPGAAYPRYDCELRRNSGTPVALIQAPAPAQPGAPLNLLLDASRLAPGRYLLLLRGEDSRGARREISRFSFLIQFE